MLLRKILPIKISKKKKENFKDFWNQFVLVKKKEEKLLKQKKTKEF